MSSHTDTYTVLIGTYHNFFFDNRAEIIPLSQGFLLPLLTINALGVIAIYTYYIAYSLFTTSVIHTLSYFSYLNLGHDVFILNRSLDLQKQGLILGLEEHSSSLYR